MVARRGWNLALSRQPLANCTRAIQAYRSERAVCSQSPNGGDAILVRDIYVADSDEQAWAEAVPEITRFWQLATDNVWCYEPITPDELPRFTELRKTTNVAGLVSTLSSAAGISENVALLPDESTRPAYVATIRHALWLCIQAQEELLNRSALFHEQGQPFHEQHLRDTLPYFLGAVGPDHVSAVQRLRTAERLTVSVNRRGKPVNIDFNIK